MVQSQSKGNHLKTSLSALKTQGVIRGGWREEEAEVEELKAVRQVVKRK